MWAMGQHLKIDALSSIKYGCDQYHKVLHLFQYEVQL